MSEKITFAVCGCGSRGLDAYASYQAKHPERMEVTAGADVRPERLELLRRRCGVAEERCFASAEELLAQPDVDGGLIGGAALKPDQFVEIVNAANQE